jgi:hypothetical protein
VVAANVAAVCCAQKVSLSMCARLLPRGRSVRRNRAERDLGIEAAVGATHKSETVGVPEALTPYSHTALRREGASKLVRVWPMYCDVTHLHAQAFDRQTSAPADAIVACKHWRLAQYILSVMLASAD